MKLTWLDTTLLSVAAENPRNCFRKELRRGGFLRLNAPTLGILSGDGERIAVQLPKDAIVEVASGPRPDDQRMVDVVWEGKTLTMFAQDIRDRGEELKSKSATKAGRKNDFTVTG